MSDDKKAKQGKSEEHPTYEQLEMRLAGLKADWWFGYRDVGPEIRRIERKLYGIDDATWTQSIPKYDGGP